MSALRLAMLTVLGLGRMRLGPGTWGSIPPVVVILVLLWAGADAWAVNTVLIATAIVFSLACVIFGRWAERYFARTDPRQVVADEVAGQCVALLFLPWHTESPIWNVALAGTAFVAFRVLDIAKPPPIRTVQHVEGGWGILLDDLAAGAVALAVAHAAAWWVWPAFL
ncbi:MAG: phosphatidylglycerophosphatase A family protein [Planctomycetota bacterium]|jgi:phosphatidylglycerophosphatase A